MLVLGIPLLMMEIAIGRKTKKGAPGAFKALNPKFEPIGWSATAKPL
jgi:NSS family neurotransmitter:Na+ symporter